VTKSADPDIRLLAALADPARLAIVRQLASDGAVCACDFSACEGISQPTVSHHLRVLREAGLVHGERRGTWIWYSLDPSVADRLAAIATGLDAQGPARPASALGGESPKRRRLPVLATTIPAPAGGRA
jgi:DNA-binding transcriptional ArsR family regulator